MKKPARIPIGICPTVDYVFKLLFGDPKSAKITIHFLNAVLGHQLRVQHVTFRNPILGKKHNEDKYAILDILAVDEHGRSINIEIQTTLPAGMRQRLTYYVSSSYSMQFTRGKKYTSLLPAICICVVTQPMFAEDPRLHLDFRLREESGLLLTDDLQVHVLQLSNLRVTAQNVREASPLEQWAYFLLHGDQMTPDEIRQLFPDPEFSDAAGVLEMVSKNPEQRQLYDARLKFQRDEAARMESAHDEGLREGIEKGIEKGIERGELLGQIKLLQSLLKVSRPTRAELAKSTVAQLSELVDKLKHQLRTRTV